MNISSETKLFLGIIIFSLILVFGALFFFTAQSQKPPLARSELLLETTATKGNASASAYLVEFSDFQCPACKVFSSVVNDISQKYADTLAIGYRHFPLDQHAYALKAATAAEAAGLQQRFWDMHDLLFQNQDTLSDEKVRELAKNLQLDMARFESDWNSNEVRDKVQKDRADGIRLGVNATPTFYLNGKKLTLSTPQDLHTAVSQALTSQ